MARVGELQVGQSHDVTWPLCSQIAVVLIHERQSVLIGFRGLCQETIPPIFGASMAGVGYQYVAVSRDAFVEQLVRYVNTGHYFYVMGRIPEHKSPESCDAKLVEKFRVSQPRWRRSRQKRAGTASVHYLRYDRTFILIATHGEHAFYDEHKANREGDSNQVRDCRRVGILFGGYLIRHVVPERGRRYTRISIATETYRDLKAYLADLAVHRSADALVSEFRNVGFEPYRPVRDQLFNILREVNRRRKAARLPMVSSSCIRSRRQVSRVFGDTNPVVGLSGCRGHLQAEVEQRDSNDHANSGKV